MYKYLNNNIIKYKFKAAEITIPIIERIFPLNLFFKHIKNAAMFSIKSEMEIIILDDALNIADFIITMSPSGVTG